MLKGKLRTGGWIFMANALTNDVFLRPEAADVRAAFGRGETGGDPRLEKIAEELGAVTNALAHLIVERGRGPRA